MTLTTKEAQKLLNSKIKHTHIIFNEEYKSDKEKHEFLCDECGYVWVTTPNILKRKDNIGCPNCNELKIIEKKKKQEFSKVRGATKLLKGTTLSIKGAHIPQEKTNELRKIKSNIKNIKQKMKNEKLVLIQVENSYKLDMEKHKEIYITKKHFGWFWALILFPIWIWYQISFSEKISPFADKVKASQKNFNDKEYSIRQLNWDLDKLEYELVQLENDIKYQMNIDRLQNRITIKLGSKTRLYYFRLRFKGKKYYKIGITINSVENRYRNGDGSNYRAIEEIFFDTYIYDSKRIEQLIIHTFKDSLANNKNILKVKGGYSEVFTRDVLGLDYE